MKIPCSAASLLGLSWALSGQGTVQEGCRDSPLAIPLPGQAHRAQWHRALAPARGRNTAWWECSRDSLGESHLPFLLSSRGSHRLIPIDHVWRVGKKNNLPHGSSNSSERSSQRLQHEQNWKQDHSLLLPQGLSFPKPISAVVRPCPDCPTTCGWGPTSLLHKARHIQVNVHNPVLPTVVPPTTDISHFTRSRVNQAQKVSKQRLLWKAAKVMLLSCSAWWCENSLLLKLSAHPARTELPPPSSQGVPVFHSRRWNLSKNAGDVQEDH